MDLLLLSNSRTPEGGYLSHALGEIAAVAGSRRKAVFVPFAGVTVDWDDYTAKLQDALAATGLAVHGLHGAADPAEAIGRAELILIGGGNTFNLLGECRRRGLLPVIAERARSGVPVIGWSAGSNLACPTICTTNDMPIVDPGGFDSLGLVDFQINPHFTDAMPPGHQGETRRQRIAEYLAANPGAVVVGLPEGDWIRVVGTRATLGGLHPAFVFRAGREAVELVAGDDVP